jgi:hypothetical protein
MGKRGERMAEASTQIVKKYPHPALQVVYWNKEGDERIYINRKLGQHYRDFAVMKKSGDSWEFEEIARGPVKESTCRDLKIQSIEEIPEKFFPEIFKK